MPWPQHVLVSHADTSEVVRWLEKVMDTKPLPSPPPDATHLICVTYRRLRDWGSTTDEERKTKKRKAPPDTWWGMDRDAWLKLWYNMGMRADLFATELSPEVCAAIEQASKVYDVTLRQGIVPDPGQGASKAWAGMARMVAWDAADHGKDLGWSDLCSTARVWVVATEFLAVARRHAMRPPCLLPYWRILRDRLLHPREHSIHTPPPGADVRRWETMVEGADALLRDLYGAADRIEEMMIDPARRASALLRSALKTAGRMRPSHWDLPVMPRDRAVNVRVTLLDGPPRQDWVHYWTDSLDADALATATEHKCSVPFRGPHLHPTYLWARFPDWPVARVHDGLVAFGTSMGELVCYVAVLALESERPARWGLAGWVAQAWEKAPSAEWRGVLSKAWCAYLRGPTAPPPTDELVKVWAEDRAVPPWFAPWVSWDGSPFCIKDDAKGIPAPHVHGCTGPCALDAARPIRAEEALQIKDPSRVYVLGQRRLDPRVSTPTASVVEALGPAFRGNPAWAWAERSVCARAAAGTPATASIPMPWGPAKGRAFEYPDQCVTLWVPACSMYGTWAQPDTVEMLWWWPLNLESEEEIETRDAPVGAGTMENLLLDG